MKTLDLTKYDGKIYNVKDTFALRFKSGSFHYVNKEELRQAFESGFEVGCHKAVYTQMPWGKQHMGYVFEISEAIRAEFFEFLKH